MPVNEYHERNRRGWDAVSDGWQAGIERRGVWRQCHRDPRLVFADQEIRWLQNVPGQRVAVLGSGDNLAVFALAGMGARVTSVDISQAQLNTAERRAHELELDIDLVRADVTDLGALATGSFDLVYTGGHVALWVSDLPLYYREAARILKPGGLLVINEYHPFRRIWASQMDRLERESSYLERGPFEYDRAAELIIRHDREGCAARSDDGSGVGVTTDGASDPAPVGLPSYEFHWTIADYVSALMGSGCTLLCLDEFGDEPEGWEEAPLTGLPRCLLLVGRKE